MALPTNTITASHQFVSAVADGGDTSLVQPSNWNATHPVTGFGVISADCTLTVGASGCDYTSVVAAFAALKNYWISPGALVTISLLGEVLNEPILRLDHPCGANILITGPTPATVSLSSIVSSSGSAGAWSHVLQLSDNSGVSVGDFLAITDPTGGTNPLRVVGLSKVTAVGGSNQVTVSTKHRNSDAASGSVTSSNVKIIKTVFKTTETANWSIQVKEQCNGGELRNLVVDCESMTNTSYGGVVVELGASLRFRGGGAGVWAPGDKQCGVRNAGSLNAGYLYVVGPYNVGAARYGVWTEQLGTTVFNGGVVTGTNYGVVSTDSGRCKADNAYSTGNIYGANCYGNGYIHAGAQYTTRMSGNVTNSTYTDNADCKISILG